MNITEPSCRLNLWRLRLTEYDLEIKHKKWSENAHADAHSRLMVGAPSDLTDTDDTPSSSIEDESAQDAHK